MGTPHNSAAPGEIAKTVLMPGDPLRAEFIAKNWLTDVKLVNQVRNIYAFTGKYQGKEVTVMASGMGMPSIGIYSYELIHFYGCKNLIRVGTAGALTPDVHVRDMVFAMGACTTSNFVRLLGLPGDYSPVCSYSLLERAVAAARERGLSFHVGNVLSSDMFYAPPKRVQGGMTWADMGVLAVEMEAAALYANAAAAGVNALAVLTISDSMVTGEATSAMERETSFTQMMEVALSLVS